MQDVDPFCVHIVELELLFWSKTAYPFSTDGLALLLVMYQVELLLLLLPEGEP